MRSSLARLIPSRPDVEAIKERAWHDERILVIHPDHPMLDWKQRQEVINIGNLIYGQGRNDGAK